MAEVHEIQKTLNQQHTLNRTIQEDVFYPAHPPRTESPEYVKTHNHLVNELDTPCWICGVKKSTLSDAQQNKFGAKDLETHHVVIEWALANCIDYRKLAEDFPGVGDQNSLQAFIDSEQNMKVLCDVHHRHTGYGIHMLTYPVWVAQRYVRDGYQLTAAAPNQPQATDA